MTLPKQQLITEWWTKALAEQSQLFRLDTTDLKPPDVIGFPPPENQTHPNWFRQVKASLVWECFHHWAEEHHPRQLRNWRIEGFWPLMLWTSSATKFAIKHNGHTIMMLSFAPLEIHEHAA